MALETAADLTIATLRTKFPETDVDITQTRLLSSSLRPFSAPHLLIDLPKLIIVYIYVNR